MNAVATKTIYTPAELLALPDEKNYELVDGRLVERTMSMLSSWVAGELHFQTRSYCQANACGWPFPGGTGYQCFTESPLKVRKPDVSFIRTARLPADAASEGYSSIAPDLAVEVVSPNDPVCEVGQKVAEWLAAGVPLVWVVHPEARAVRVHRRGGPVSWLRAEDELSGEEVLPGFHCRVAAIFSPRGRGRARPGSVLSENRPLVGCGRSRGSPP
jgi:Uma2 family endonuclease